MIKKIIFCLVLGAFVAAVTDALDLNSPLRQVVGVVVAAAGLVCAMLLLKCPDPLLGPPVDFVRLKVGLPLSYLQYLEAGFTDAELVGAGLAKFADAEYVYANADKLYVFYSELSGMAQARGNVKIATLLSAKRDFLHRLLGKPLNP